MGECQQWLFDGHGMIIDGREETLTSLWNGRYIPILWTYRLLVPFLLCKLPILPSKAGIQEKSGFANRKGKDCFPQARE